MRGHQIHYFEEASAFASELAHSLACESAPVSVHGFPDGETLLKVHTPVAPDALLVSVLHRPNAKILETLLAADALRRAGATHLSLIAPYLPYMRQDRVFRPGEAISQQVIAGLLGNAFDRILTLEAHLHRTEALSDVFRVPAHSLCAGPLLADWLRGLDEKCLVVGPDSESGRLVQCAARRAALPWVVADKKRWGDTDVSIQLPSVRDHRHAIIVDDIASSGATIAAAARALQAAGVERVDAAIVHALLSPMGVARIHRAGVRNLASCDSIPDASNQLHCAPLFRERLAVEEGTGKRPNSGSHACSG